MHRSHKSALGVLITAIAVLVGAVPAVAEDFGNGNQKGAKGKITIEAGTEFLPEGSEGKKISNCTDSSVQYYVQDDFGQPVLANFHLTDAIDGFTLTSFTFNAAFGRPPDARLFSPTGRWYGAFCDGDLNFLPEGGPAVTVPGLVRRAVDSLDPADPTLLVTPHHGKHVVNMKSWLAIDPVYWNKERLAEARAGRVVVRAWLDPMASSWDMGDGETEVCFGPGLPWRRGIDEDRATCHYTYDWPSINPPDHTYDLTGTVSFEVHHTTNAPGSYGPFVPVERSTTETIQVVEIQAVGS